MPETFEPRDFVTKLVRLSIGNRQRGRLRVSLKSVLDQLQDQFGERPERIFIADQEINVTSGDRAFLPSNVTRRLGGFQQRAGTRARVRFLLPLRLHIFDVFFAGDNSQYQEDTRNIDNAVHLFGSGLGVLIRTEWCKRGDPVRDLRLISKRLRKNRTVLSWLEGFLDQGADLQPVEGEARLRCDPSEENKKNWAVQIYRADDRGNEQQDATLGPVQQHARTHTRFKWVINDIPGLATLPVTFTMRSR